MDEVTRKAIITWINCLQIGPDIDDLRELHDGRHFISLLKIMKTDYEKEKLKLKNWPSNVKHFLEEYYDVGLQDDLNFAAAEMKNEFELAKISILVLCASVHCNGKDQFIKALCKLDSSVQEIIKSIIEGVLSPSGTTLCHDFVKVLKVDDSALTSNCLAVPCIKIWQEKPLSTCTIYCDEGDAYSPIKQCFQTPQVASWMAIKDKETEIHKLREKLETEFTSRSYLESDLQDLKKENCKLVTNVEALKKTVRDLTEKCDNLTDCQNTLANTELDFQKLQMKYEEQQKIVSDYPSLEMAYKKLNEENRSLEESLVRLEKQLKVSEARVLELISSEDTLTELKAVLLAKDNEIKCFETITKDQELELKELRHTQLEMSKLVEDNSKRHDVASGESMKVVSDIIALEKDIKRLHDEALVKEKHIERLTKAHSEEKLQLEQELKNANSKAQRAINEIQSVEAEVGIQRDNIAKQEDKLVSIQEQHIKERRELKSLIEQQSDYVQLLQDDIKEKCLKLSDLEKLSVTQKGELEICHAEMKSKETCIERLKEEKAGIMLDCDALLKAKEALASEIEANLITEKGLVAEVCSCRSEIENLTSSLNVKCLESAELAVELAALKTDHERFQEELASKKKCIDDLETKKREMVSEHEKLAEENDVKAEQMRIYQERLDQLSVSLENKQAVITNLEYSLQSQEEKLSTSNMESCEKDKRIHELEVLMSDKETFHRSEIKNLTSTLDIKCSESASLQLEVTTLKAEVERFQEELSNKDKVIVDLEVQKKEIVWKHEKIVEENDVKAEQMKTCQERLDQLSVSLENKQTEITNLEYSLQSLAERLSTSDMESRDKDERIHELEVLMSDKEKFHHLEIENLASTLDIKCSESASLLLEVTTLKAEVKRLQEELSSKDKVIGDLEMQKKEISSKHEKIVEENNVKAEQMRTYQERLDQLNASLYKKQAEISNLEGCVQNLKEKLNSSDQESRGKEERIQELELLRNDMEKFHLEVMDKNAAHIKALEMRESEMKQKCKALVDEKESLLAENATLEKRFACLSQDFLSKCTEMSSIRDSATALEEEANKYIVESEAKCSHIDQLMATNVEISSKYQELVKEKVALISEMNSIQGKLKRLSNLESQNTLRQQHHDGILRRNMELTTENGDLKIQIQQLKTKLDCLGDLRSRQNECTEQVAAMQVQIQDAEMRHHNIVRSMQEELQNATNKYEKAKSVIEEMVEGSRAKDEKLEAYTRQLEKYREHYQTSRESLAKVMSLQKEAEEGKSHLKERLDKEMEKTAQQAARIKRLELLLNQNVQKVDHRRSFSEDTFVKPQQVEQQPRGHPRRPSITVTYNSAERYHLMFDDQLQNQTALSINAAPQDLKMDDGFAHPRTIVPHGANNYFPCEDEEGELLNFSYLTGENADPKDSKNTFLKLRRSSSSTSRLTEDPDGAFSNVSYLNDLKNGRCELADESQRLSELQRRNTLCLPHLKTSYPVEMQSQILKSYKDEDLKTSRLDMTGLSQISTIHPDQSTDLTSIGLGARKKITKPIQPTYQKPGPPTPGKSSKSGAGQDKHGKTPSSLKRLLRRSHFRTPKGTKKVTPRKNRENQPPEQTQAPRPRRNLAFTIGLSPKVKSHPKSLATSKKTSTPKK